MSLSSSTNTFLVTVNNAKNGAPQDEEKPRETKCMAQDLQRSVNLKNKGTEPRHLLTTRVPASVSSHSSGRETRDSSVNNPISFIVL